MQVDAAYAGITCYNDPRLLKYRYKFSNLEIPIFVFKIFLAAGREQSLSSRHMYCVSQASDGSHWE